MNTDELEIWTEKILRRVANKKWQNVYLKYVELLAENDVPIIFEINHLGKLLNIKTRLLAQLITLTPNFYRSFEIPKASGGMRRIDAPEPTLLHVQKWIAQNILSAFHISSHAHGFIKGRSIITNARVHVGTPCLLKTDIETFFPTISLKRVTAIFRFLGYSPSVSYYLSALCCLNGSLPQGSAASPQLSNIIATPLDRRLGALAASYDLNFTRYADDLTFSGSYIPIKFISVVEEIVRDEGFSLNAKKTRLMRGPGRRIVTGISIGSGELKLPRTSRRKLRQDLFWLEKKGILSQSEFSGIYDPLYVDRLLGKLSFWHSIEPKNEYVAERIKQLKNLIKIEEQS